MEHGNTPLKNRKLSPNELARGAVMSMDMLVTIAIVAVLAAAVFFLYRVVSSDVGATTVRANAVTIETGVRGLVNHSRQYGNGSYLDSLRVKGKLPEQWYACSGSTCEYFTDWGALAINGAGNTWTMQLNDVPAEACISLVTQELFDRTQSVSINGTSYDGKLVDQSDAGSDCDNETNVLIWTQR